MNGLFENSHAAGAGWRGIFLGPRGLRAGWRLAIFAAVLAPAGYGANRVIEFILRKLHADFYTPLGGAVVTGGLAAALLLASAFMARVEGRSLGDYGLPWRRAFCSRFWQGASLSFASLTALLLVLRLLGVARIGPMELQGAALWKYAAAWTVPLFLAALLEDFFYRGYLLFTLANGIGFWPAACVTSLLMGGAHYFNPGGHGLGPVAVTLYCLVTCLALRRTGDLWMMLGIHSAWNWGEVSFYGVPASGQEAAGRLLATAFRGPVWLTGGSFGPEASAVNLLLLAAWGLGFSRWLHGVKYPALGRAAPAGSGPASNCHRIGAGAIIGHNK
jgi:hypothetical protein